MPKRHVRYAVEITFNKKFLARFALQALPNRTDVDAFIPHFTAGRMATLLTLLICAHAVADAPHDKLVLQDLIDARSGNMPIKWSEDSGVLNGDSKPAAEEDISDIPF
jgi:hypothetical protein